MIAPVPVKQPWRIWVMYHVNPLRSDNITTTKQSSTTIPLIYSMTYNLAVCCCTLHRTCFSHHHVCVARNSKTTIWPFNIHTPQPSISSSTQATCHKWAVPRRCMRHNSCDFTNPIDGLPVCVLSYIFAWHRGSSGQRPPVACTGD